MNGEQLLIDCDHIALIELAAPPQLWLTVHRDQAAADHHLGFTARLRSLHQLQELVEFDKALNHNRQNTALQSLNTYNRQ